MDLKSLLPLAVMTAVSLTTDAQPVETRLKDMHPRMTETVRRTIGHHGAQTTECRIVSPVPATVRAGAATVTVTPEAICDAGAEQKLLALKACNNADGSFYTCSVSLDGEIEENFELEPGDYDFIFIWRAPDGMRVVVKQNIAVSGEMSVKADASEATNHFVYDMKMPDGTSVAGENFDEHIYIADLKSSIVYKNEVVMAYLTNIVDYSTGISTRNKGDVWSNGAQGLDFFEYIVTAHDEGNYIILAGVDPSKPGIYSNNPSDYYTRECNIADNNLYVPAPDPYDEVDHSLNASACAASWKDGCLNMSSKNSVSGATWNWQKYFICNDKVNAPAISVTPVFTRLNWMADNHEEALTFAPLYDPSDDVWTPSYIAEAFGQNYMMTAFVTDDNGAMPLETDKDFSVSYEEPVVFADNAPTVTFIRPANVMQYSFIGRYGELREADLHNHSLSITCDGTEVCSSYSDLSSFGWSDEAKAEGPWDISIVDENFKVDGLQGKTSCDQHFVAGPRESTPTVTIMQFRNGNGHPAFRFDRDEEAAVAFRAGAFKYEVSYTPFWRQYFDYSSLSSVKMEYSPYGAEKWQEIAVDEDQSKYFHSSGAYYSGSLAAVTGSGKTGWYDVRITIADEKGNTQQQVVSPAFLVGAPDSITTPEADTADENAAEYYTLQGVRINNPQPGNVVIVRRGNSVTKELVR